MNETITIEANIHSSVARVWECWTKPEHIMKWNFASPEWSCPKAENDLRAGGRFYSRMEARDGSAGFDFEGVYDEVALNQIIRYTMPDGRTVNAQFEHDNNITTLTITFDAEKMNAIEMQRAGWQSILNNFKKYVENQ